MVWHAYLIWVLILKSAAGGCSHALVVAVSTHPEDDTLYCLNDLHKASGGAEKHQVAHFRVYSKSRNFENKIISQKGRYGGSYANEKTVYKYAAWIDDDFYDAVFDAFKASPPPYGVKGYGTPTY